MSPSESIVADFWSGGPNIPDAGGWKFFSYDNDIIWMHQSSNVVGRSVPDGLFNTLMNHEEFRILFRDRFYRHCFHGGVLTSDRGSVVPNYLPVITGPAGATIYATTDGSDSRLPGGGINPVAVVVTSPAPASLAVNGVKLIRLRPKTATTWSPLNEATFSSITIVPAGPAKHRGVRNPLSSSRRRRRVSRSDKCGRGSCGPERRGVFPRHRIHRAAATDAWHNDGTMRVNAVQSGNSITETWRLTPPASATRLLARLLVTTVP